jgi:hypothetical protein
MNKRSGSIFSSVRKVFRDTFNRTDTASGLGVATDGSLWDDTDGDGTPDFRILGNKAVATSAVSGYPIASISMPDSPLDQDVVISLKGTTNGTGAALWITDSGNWWAVTTGQQLGENCNCGTCTTCNAGNCNAGNCTANGPCNAGPCNTTQTQRYNAPVSGTNYGYNVNPNTPTNTWNGGSCRAWNCPVTGNRFCRAWTAACSQLGEPVCNAWNSRNCRQWRNTPPRGNCTAWNQGFCRSSNRPCTAYASRTNAPCNAWNFGNCNSNPCDAWNFATQVWNSTTYGYNTNPFTTPGTATGVWNACTGGFCSGVYNCATYACTSYTCTTFTSGECNCQTCFPTYIRLIRSVSGTVSEITRWVISSLGTQLVNSLKITTSGTQITIEPFANADLTGKIGSDLVYTPTGVTLSSSYGIIVEPSPTSQGYEIDEITIEKI